MSTEDKKTDNELIADFMGLPVKEWFDKSWYNVGGYWVACEKLKYDTSWNDLMPVVERLNNALEDYFEKHSIKPDMDEGYSDLNDVPVTSSIITVYEAVINLIRFYNTQPK